MAVTISARVACVERRSAARTASRSGPGSTWACSKGSGVGLFVAASGPDVLAVEAGFADRRVQGALERQGEHGRGGVDLDREAGRRGIAQPQRASLDLAVGERRAL